VRFIFAFFLLWVLSAFLGPRGYAQDEMPENGLREIFSNYVSILSLTSPGGDWVAVFRRGSPTGAALNKDYITHWGVAYSPEHLHRKPPSYYPLVETYDLKSGRNHKLRLPFGSTMEDIAFHPDGQLAALSVIEPAGQKLYVLERETGVLTDAQIEGYSSVFQTAAWLPNSTTLIGLKRAGSGLSGEVVRSVSEFQSSSWPVVKQITGPRQDTVRPLTSDLFLYNYETGNQSAIGKPAVYTGFEINADGRRFSASIIPESSETVTAHWDIEKETIGFRLADRNAWAPIDLPRLDNNSPAGWHPNAPSQLVFETTDGPSTAPNCLRVLDIQDVTDQNSLGCFGFKIGSIYPIDGSSLYLVGERARPGRDRAYAIYDEASAEIMTIPAHTLPENVLRLEFPVTHRASTGRHSAYKNDERIFFKASARRGNVRSNAIISFDLADHTFELTWQNRPGKIEQFVDFCFGRLSCLIVSSQDEATPPNLYRVENNDTVLLTDFSPPTKAGVSFETIGINYTRSDGLGLSAEVFVPGAVTDASDVPVFIWSYPREYKSRRTARETFINPPRYRSRLASPRLAPLLSGCIVVNNAAMPILSEDGAPPNDDFLQQINLNASALIEALQQRSIGDIDRLIVSGHSYGAFMALNLLAHTEYFTAAVGMSGAYNRTLTPFGYQNEKRTLWDAKDNYLALSPFMRADRIKKPVLLIHGAKDNNPGTMPVQSRKLFEALERFGQPAKLVILENEGHRVTSVEGKMQVAEELMALCEEMKSR